MMIDMLTGQYTECWIQHGDHNKVDRFATSNNAQVQKFNCRYACPGQRQWMHLQCRRVATCDVAITSAAMLHVVAALWHMSALATVAWRMARVQWQGS